MVLIIVDHGLIIHLFPQLTKQLTMVDQPGLYVGDDPLADYC